VFMRRVRAVTVYAQAIKNSGARCRCEVSV
jgi:hypothetical protein